MTGERFHCLNCFADGELTIHGGCDRCGSQAVMSLHQFPLAENTNQNRPIGQYQNEISAGHH